VRFVIASSIATTAAWPIRDDSPSIIESFSSRRQPGSRSILRLAPYHSKCAWSKRQAHSTSAIEPRDLAILRPHGVTGLHLHASLHSPTSIRNRTGSVFDA
jgi:hypothetical protein